MKVNELRDKLMMSSPDRVSRAMIEAYKMVPRAKKEELDQIIEEILSGRDVSRARADQALKELTAESEAFYQQIDLFIDNVRAGYYYKSNTVIPKNERSKWRFTAKDFIKKLNEVPAGSSYYVRSGEYLGKLYRLLSDGSSLAFFTSEDPFRSVGMAQEEMFDELARRRIASRGCTEEVLRETVRLMAECEISQNSSRPVLMDVFLKIPQPGEERDLARKVLKEVAREKKEALPGIKEPYERGYQERIVNLLNCGAIVLTALSGNADEEVRSYLQSSGKDRNTAVQQLISQFEISGLYKEAVEAYDYAVSAYHLRLGYWVDRYMDELRQEL